VTPRDLERFFRTLARTWPHPLECLVIGGAAAVLDGSTRPTTDIDFEVKFDGPSAQEDMDAFAGALHAAEAASGIEGQFTQNISAWSPITLPPYRKSATRWKQFGPVVVKRLAPPLYVVTKLRRGNANDWKDLLLVAKRHHVSWKSLANLCAVAVRLSPYSTSVRTFRGRTEYLFRRYGSELWGTTFSPDIAIAQFRKGQRVRRGSMPR